MTVIPAYGRDYKSATAAKKDWLAGKDFVICDISSQFDGRPINQQDAVGQSIMVRYSKLTKIARLQ
jgi:hypothetical protein